MLGIDIRTTSLRTVNGTLSPGANPENSSLFIWDEADASTVFTDVYNPTDVYTLDGTVETDTDDTAPGYPGSLRINGASPGRIDTPNNSRWDFGTSDFTVEAWINPDTAGTSAVVCGLWDQWGTAGLGWVLLLNPSEQLSFYANTTAGVLYPSAGAPGYTTRNAWQHVAVCKSGSNLSMWLAGTRVYENLVFNDLAACTDNRFSIAAHPNASNVSNTPWYPNVGLIGALHTRKGFAKYSGATITPSLPIAFVP